MKIAVFRNISLFVISFCSLGSTRFFKVAKAVSNEGLVVVKVFVLHDLSLLLQPYQQRIEDIKLKLASAFNCLPFRKAIVSARSSSVFHCSQRILSYTVLQSVFQLENGAAFLIREYVKYSLYDRMSTRPFLAPIEKKWIAFQILYALHQCHKVGVSHPIMTRFSINIRNIDTKWTFRFVMAI